MENTIWYRGTNGGVYMQEELRAIWYNENPKEKFMLCNFLAWLDSKGFKRIN